MAKATETKHLGLKKVTRKTFDFGFGKFQADISSQLSNDVVQKLATYFEFSRAKFDKVKSDSLAFVRVLEEEEGIITPTDISSLINALRFIEQGGIATAVQKAFERNQTRITSEPVVFSSELKRKHFMLVTALKEVYRRRYSGVKPIPFLNDTWYCVNDIFVESRIEVLDNSKSKKDPHRWSSIKSRHDLFTKTTFERHITIEGDPGFGKSTLLLQYAYDWCTSAAESPLNNSYIFILLRLKHFQGDLTIYDAIRMLLPEDLHITTQDIKEIVISGHWKVMMAFDGYDEYSGMDNKATDISKIIQGRMLTSCIIIMATRSSCIPKFQSPTVTHCKLTGFDQSMQEEYIDKAITSQAASLASKLIMRKLKENVVLSDICQVPLFLATFVHMNSNGAEYQKLTSVTSYFSFMVASFFGHLQNKAMGFSGQSVEEESTENPDQRLQIAKLAFDGLTGKEQKLLWRQDDLLKHLKPSCVERYINVGILLKEEQKTFKVISGSNAENQIEKATYVGFFHNTFQEYYAAHYIAYLAERQNKDTIKKILSKFDIYNYQYVLGFACGLKPTAAAVVQNYLKELGKEGRAFSILCILEQEEGAIDSTIAQLCSELITIDSMNSRLFQRSTIQLLQTASQQNVPISSMSLRDCFESVDVKEASICLSSGLRFPRLDTLRELDIRFRFGHDLRDRARDILDFSSRCVALKALKFYRGILLPQSFDDRDILARFLRQNCEVEWFPRHLSWVQLNLQTGKWDKEDKVEMTDDEYRRESLSFLSTKKMSEPRLTIRNVATNHLLYVGSSREATTSSEDKEGTQAALFKVQWCERINDKIAKTVLIRTDNHPQPLLDVRDLHYQGNAFDPQKCYDKNRWWKMRWLQATGEGEATVLLQSYSKGTHLAEKIGGAGVEVIQLSENADVKSVPDRAKWQLTIGGQALSPGKAAVVYVGLSIMKVTGGAAIPGAAGPMPVAFTASGGISAATPTVPFGILEDLSKRLFVDW